MPGGEMATSKYMNDSAVSTTKHLEDSVFTNEIENSSMVDLHTEQSKLCNVNQENVNQSNNGRNACESVDESLIDSVNTLDDISSLKTGEEDNASMALNDDEIGEIDTKLSPESLKEPPELSQNSDEEEMEGEWIDVIGSGDIMKKVIRKGSGFDSRPQRGQLVKVRIIGSLEDGKVIENEEAKEIIVGDGEVIQGIDLIIPLMELNEITEVVIKSRLAYGSIGKQPEIPPNSTVTYEIELLTVEDEPDPEKMTFSERLVIGDKKRNDGNFWYGRGEFSCALQCYRRALDFLDDNTPPVLAELTQEQKELAAMWMTVSNNMAAAQLKIGAYDAALKSIENVLKVQPRNVKALYRKSRILNLSGNIEASVETLKKLLQIEPENKMFQQDLSNAFLRMKQEKKSERDMYKRMFGQDKPQTPSITVTEDKTKHFLKWGLLAGILTAALTSIFVYKHLHTGTTY